MACAALKYTVRPAKDFDEAKALWWPLMQELGWNRAIDDAKTHFSVAQNGKTWLLVIPEPYNLPQGMILPLLYPNKTAWIGFFIMNAHCRGKGLGAALWREMELVFRNAGTETIGLDAVPEQVETYKRRGFVDCAGVPCMKRESLAIKPLEITWSYEDSVELQDLRDIDPKYMAQLDFEHTGLDRSAYWTADALPARKHTLGYAIVADGELTGLIYARNCPRGIRIGPLYAARYSQARQLLHKLMNDYANRPGEYAAEIFGLNEQGQKVFEELGWEYAGVTYQRMWKNGKVPREQQIDGKGAKSMYAIFDAGSG